MSSMVWSWSNCPGRDSDGVLGSGCCLGVHLAFLSAGAVNIEDLHTVVAFGDLARSNRAPIEPSP